MKKILFLITVAIALYSCGGKGNNPTPNNQPTNYSKGRKPLPKWGVDTFIAVHGAQNRIDSFYSFIGSNGESLIKHNGKQYVLWIDSALLSISTDTTIYPSVNIGSTLNDSTSLNKFQIIYRAPYYYQGFNGPVLSNRWIDFGDPLLNANADNYLWMGRLN